MGPGRRARARRAVEVGEGRRLPTWLDAAATFVGRAVGATAVAVGVGAATGGEGDPIDSGRPAGLARALGGVWGHRARRRAGRRRRRVHCRTAVEPRGGRGAATLGVARGGAVRLPSREQAASVFVAEAPVTVGIAVRIGTPARHDAVVGPRWSTGATGRRRRPARAGVARRSRVAARAAAGWLRVRRSRPRWL